MDYSLPGSSVPGIHQSRTLEWVAMPSSRGSFQPRDQMHVSTISCIGRQILYHKCYLGNTLLHSRPYIYIYDYEYQEEIYLMGNVKFGRCVCVFFFFTSFFILEYVFYFCLAKFFFFFL